MKGIIIIEPPNEQFKDFTNNYDISLESDMYGYSISIISDLNQPYDELIKNHKEFYTSLKIQLENLSMFGDENEYTKSLYKLMQEKKGKEISLLEDAEFVRINYDIDSAIKYINLNPSLKNKKIVISNVDYLTPDVLEKILNCLGMNPENIYIKLPENNAPVCYKECKETLDIIEKMVCEIGRFKLSPLEKAMYAYDIVRNRVYTQEDENEPGTKSRDLTSVLLGDKIVCLGYANILKALLMRLGINCEIALYQSTQKDSGHARVLANIDDIKYGIKGAYYFDPTADSKTLEGGNQYLLSYRCFAKTKTQITEFDAGKLEEKYFPYFSNEMLDEFIDYYADGWVSNIPKRYIHSINRMSRFINHESLIDPMIFVKLMFMKEEINKEIFGEIERLISLFDNPIPADIMLQVLYNVRKYQYYMNPDEYPFNISDFYRITVYSKWEFEKMGLDELLEFLFPEKSVRTLKQSMLQYGCDSGLFQDLERVRLVRTLRTVYDNKKSSQ